MAGARAQTAAEVTEGVVRTACSAAVRMAASRSWKAVLMLAVIAGLVLSAGRAESAAETVGTRVLRRCVEVAQPLGGGFVLVGVCEMSGY